MSLHTTIHLPSGLHIAAICGAGGKTSLMYALARESCAAGKKTAIMTTTRMQRPLAPDLMPWQSCNLPALSRAAELGRIVAAGGLGPDGRIAPPDAQMLRALYKWADAIYVEADGAHCKPLKYPAVWEPVIPQFTDTVIVLGGLSALGQPLELVCHRAELIPKRLGLCGAALDEAAMAQILAVGYGRYDPIVLLNQADDAAARLRGEAVRAQLVQLGMKQVYIISLKELGAARGGN